MELSLTFRDFLYYIILTNIFGFVGMWWDKRCAIKKRWRQSENSLLLLAVIGGSAGIFVSMHMFRHKTHNRLFIVGIPIIIYTQQLIFFAYTQFANILIFDEFLSILNL